MPSPALIEMPVREFEVAAVEIAAERAGRALTALERNRAIVAAVARTHGLQPGQIMLRHVRHRRVSLAKREAIWRIDRYWRGRHVSGRLSLSQIGAFFGLHHTTVLHHLQIENQRRAEFNPIL